MNWFGRRAEKKLSDELYQWHVGTTVPFLNSVLASMRGIPADERFEWFVAALVGVVSSAQAIGACAKNIQLDSNRSDVWRVTDPAAALQHLTAVSGYVRTMRESVDSLANGQLEVLCAKRDALFGSDVWQANLFRVQLRLVARVEPGGFFFPSGCVISLVDATLRGQRSDLSSVLQEEPSEEALIRVGVAGIAPWEAIEWVSQKAGLFEVARSLASASAQERQEALDSLLGIAQ